MNAYRGRFITLEGGEGVGKSTQIAALSNAIRARGLKVVTTREPGGSEGAEEIRQLLLEGNNDRWGPRAEALLFAAARADHIEKLIQPAIDNGAWVLCDRFIDSSRAYQGRGSLLGDADIMALHRIGSGGFMPDRTLILTLDQATAQRRASARNAGATDRFEARGTDFHADVADAFMRFAAEDPIRYRMIPALGAPGEVTARLLDALADLLP